MLQVFCEAGSIRASGGTWLYEEREAQFILCLLQKFIVSLPVSKVASAQADAQKQIDEAKQENQKQIDQINEQNREMKQNAENMQNFMNAMGLWIGQCKITGWNLQGIAKSATAETIDAVEQQIWEAIGYDPEVNSY